MKGYPLFLDLTHRPCVVIGGGSVAERKVAGLVEAGATVTVISPQLTERLRQWVREDVVQYVARAYKFGDLSGFLLAFATTGNLAVDAAVFADGKATGVLVNSADDPVRCDFFLPAVIRRGDLAIAVSTGGASPALARAVREELQEIVGEEYATLLEIAAATRVEVLRSGAAVPGDRWTMALKEPEFRRLVHEGQKTEAATRLRTLLKTEEKNDVER